MNKIRLQTLLATVSGGTHIYLIQSLKIKEYTLGSIYLMAFNGRRNFTSGNGNESEDDKLKRLQVTCRNIIYKPQNHNVKLGQNQTIIYIIESYSFPSVYQLLQKELEEEERKNREIEKMNAAIMEKNKVL